MTPPWASASAERVRKTDLFNKNQRIEPTKTSVRTRPAKKLRGICVKIYESNVIPNVIKPGLLAGMWVNIYVYLIFFHGNKNALSTLAAIAGLLWFFQIIDPRTPYSSQPAKNNNENSSYGNE